LFGEVANSIRRAEGLRMGAAEQNRRRPRLLVPQVISAAGGRERQSMRRM